MFTSNNPFEEVKKRKDLNALEKMRLAIKLNQADEKQVELTRQAIPLLKNPRILASMLESNRKFLCPYWQELIEEGQKDGSIQTQYPEVLSEFLVLMDLWMLPSVFPADDEGIHNRHKFIFQLLEKIGLPLYDQEIGDLLEKAVPAIDAATDPMAKDFVGADECFVLSRGVSSALAFECGLKLQETCYIRARAYHSSDFYHGPMAMIAEGTKVILFASKHSLHGGDEVHRADCRKCAEKMCELGADLYIVTDDAEAYEDLIAHIVESPGGECEAQTVFFFALAVQMLACKTSCGKGLSPDSPRALKKVTVTK